MTNTTEQERSEFEFCIASGAGCSIGAHGRKGEIQCEWCGKEYPDQPLSVKDTQEKG